MLFNVTNLIKATLTGKQFKDKYEINVTTHSRN